MNGALSQPGRRVALWSAWVAAAPFLLPVLGAWVFAAAARATSPLQRASILDGEVLVVVIVLARRYEGGQAATGTPMPHDQAREGKPR